MDFSEIQDLPESILRRFRTEDLINPKPAVFAEAESGQLGGVVSRRAGTAPAEPVVQRRTTQGGFFGGFGASADDDAERRFSQMNPIDSHILEMGRLGRHGSSESEGLVDAAGRRI